MILDCHGLGRSFGGIEAVADISFALDEGQSMALIGPNGAGKSTTLGMLTTALRPDRGGATVAGADIVTQAARVRASLGVLFQEPALDDRLSPRQTLRLHAAMHALPRHGHAAAVEKALDWANLTDQADRPLRGFSGGMKRRLELARALMHSPRLLVLDEPTLGLDPQGRLDLWSRIDALRAGGMAVLMTTHAMAEAERCDRIGVIDKGRLLAIGTRAELALAHGGHAHADLEKVFLGLTGRALRDAFSGPPARVLRMPRRSS